MYSLEKKISKKIEPFEKELEQALKSNNYKYAVKIIANMKYYQNVYERLINLKLKFKLNELWKIELTQKEFIFDD